MELDAEQIDQGGPAAGADDVPGEVEPEGLADAALDGVALLGLNDGDGATRVVLGVFNGKPELTFSGSDGKVVWKAP